MTLSLPIPTRSLKIKLILSYLVILAVGGVATSIIGSWIVSATIMRQARRAAEHDLIAARTMYEAQRDAIGRTLQLTAAAASVQRCVGAGDCGLAMERLGRVARESALDFLSLTDGAGRVILRTTQPDRTGDDATRLAVVRAAIAGTLAVGTETFSPEQLEAERSDLPERAYMPVVATPRARPTDQIDERSGLVMCAAAPVVAGGRVGGVLYAGRLVNRRFDLVDRTWELLYQGEQHRGKDVGTVTVFHGDVRVVTTVRSADGQRAIGTRVSAEVGDAVLGRGESWHDRAFVVNDWYISAYEPIRSYDGTIVGILYVGLLERVYTSIRNRVILSFFGIATIGFGLIIGLTYVMIGNITRPIDEMVAATRDIAAGRLDHEVRVNAEGEVALLADSFNAMLASIRHMKSDLEAWGSTLEQKVQERTDELAAMHVRVAQAERLASLGMLAAGVAHEVNNPLGGILALTALTLEDLDPDHPDRSNLEEVVRQTERCRDIVKGLLEFSRQSTGAMEVVNPNQILQHTLNLVARQSTFFNVEITVTLDPELPPVPGDRSQLQQVFLNMLVNAAQAMGEQGRIAIRSYTGDDGFVVVSIADTGDGIPPEQINHIFDPFFTMKSGGRGTGLGLSIAYGIVTHHGGSIGVESEVGRGTTLTVRLPAWRGEGRLAASA